MPITKTQQKQLDFLLGVEPFETLTHQPSLDASCKDCMTGGTFKSSDGARCFVLSHAGHRTWVKNLGWTRPKI